MFTQQITMLCAHAHKIYANSYLPLHNYMDYLCVLVGILGIYCRTFMKYYTIVDITGRTSSFALFLEHGILCVLAPYTGHYVNVYIAAYLWLLIMLPQLLCQ